MTLRWLIGIIVALATMPLILEKNGIFQPSLRSRLFYFIVRWGYKPFTYVSLAKKKKRLEYFHNLVPLSITSRAIRVGEIPAEWVQPLWTSNEFVLLYLHGGGYTSGSPALHRDLAHRIASASGMPALVIDYRLAPEHPFPAALEDAAFAYRWLLARNYPPERIVLAGDSAGGGLSAALLMYLRDAGEPLPAAAALLSPWTDLCLTGESIDRLENADPQLTRRGLQEMAGAYRGQHAANEPLISPLYGDLHGLPPLLILAGTREILLDDSVMFAERAGKAGVNVTLHIREDMGHVWPAFAMLLPESKQAIQLIGNFFRRHTGL